LEPSGDELTVDLVRSDPERAWPLVVQFASEHPEDASATSLLEEFIYEHDDRYIDRMEEAARAHPMVKELIAQAYVGGIAGSGIEEFHRLQGRLRRELGWPVA
jgi:hypothetical protein